jgi:hypothetical protein
MHLVPLIDVASNAKSILQNAVNQLTSLTTWTVDLLLKALLTVMQPISIFVLLFGLILWFTGLERRLGKRMVVGALIIWFITLIV